MQLSTERREPSKKPPLNVAMSSSSNRYLACSRNFVYDEMKLISADTWATARDMEDTDDERHTRGGELLELLAY